MTNFLNKLSYNHFNFFLIEKEYHNYFINSTYHKKEAKVFDSR
nr:MAG TPA: hypothetical protein [Caudoviricetes sp.]